MSLSPYKIVALRKIDHDNENILPHAPFDVRYANMLVAPVYASSGGDPFPAPLKVNANGEANIWLEDGAYKIKVGDSQYFDVYIGDNYAAIDAALGISGKEEKSNKAQNLISPNETTYPSTKAVKDALDSVSSGQTPMGAWDASTNTPELASGVGVAGQYYEVSVAGETDLDGESSWEVGDKAIFNGTVWTRIPSSAVRSVNGETGDVVIDLSDRVQSVATIADLRALTGVVVGQKFSVSGHTVVGVGAGTFTAIAGTDADDDGLTIITSNGIRVRRDAHTLRLDDFGITGASDLEGPKIEAFLSACDGRTADLQCRGLVTSTPISVTVSSINIINPAKIFYTGSPAVRAGSFVRFGGVSGRFICAAGLHVDAGNWFAKGLNVTTTDDNAVVLIDQPTTSNCQTDTTANQLAAGLHVVGPADLVKISQPTSYNIDHSLNPASSSRGILVGYANGHPRRVVIIDPDISNVGPSQDGDGIYVAGVMSEKEQHVTIVRGTYVDCAKRAIKTQSTSSKIINPTVHRTQDFPSTQGGQAEIDCQYGNAVIINPIFRYHAATAYPAEGLVKIFPQAGVTNGVGTKILGGSCTFDNPLSKTVGVGFYAQSLDAADVNRSSEISNFNFHGILQTPFYFRPAANAEFGFVAIQGFTIRNFYCENLAGENAALIWRGRAGGGYALSSDVAVNNVIVRDAPWDVPIDYQVTSNTGISYKCVSGNFRLITPDPFRLESNKGMVISAAQNGTVSQIIQVPFNTAVRITYSYASGGAAATHLYLDCLATLGNDSGESQIVSFHEKLTHTDSGTISLSATFVSGVGWNLWFQKTAGSATLTGNAYIFFQSGGLGRVQ